LNSFDEIKRSRRSGNADRWDDEEERRSWPRSASLLVIVLIASNLVLMGFLFKDQIKRFEPAAKSAAPALNRPAAEPQPDLNPAPDQNSNADLKPVPARSPTVDLQPTPAHVPLAAPPKLTKAKRSTASVMQHRKPLKTTIHRTFSHARYFAPRAAPNRATATVPATAPVPNYRANVAPPPAVVASVPSPTVGVRNQPELQRKTITPAVIGSGLGGNGVQSSTNARTTTRVASVGLPEMDKGLIKPSMPVAPLSPKLEIVPRPKGLDREMPNCGGLVFIPCPTLHTRSESSADGDQ
jgi:hypothetical protein